MCQTLPRPKHCPKIFRGSLVRQLHIFSGHFVWMIYRFITVVCSYYVEITGSISLAAGQIHLWLQVDVSKILPVNNFTCGPDLILKILL